MSKEKKNLTEGLIEALKPKDKPYFIWDAKQPGLGVKVEVSGFTSYVFQYRLNGYKRSVIAPTKKIDLKRAREKAKIYSSLVVDRIDPFEAEKSPTVYEVCKEYLETRKEGTAKEVALSTFVEWKGQIEVIGRTKLGKKPIKEVKLRDAYVFFELFENTPTYGNRIKSLLNLVFKYAAKKAYREDGGIWLLIDRYDEVKHRSRLEENLHDQEKDQPTLFFNYMKKAQSGEVLNGLGAPIDPAWIGLILLFYFTGARPREIQDIKISQIDLIQKEIKKSMSKTGAKPIYLNEEALIVLNWSLEKIPRKEGNLYVFAGKYGRGYRKTWNGRQWKNLQESTGITATPYSIRRYFMTTGKRLQLQKGENNLKILSEIVSHKTEKITDMYAGELPEELQIRRNIILQENELLGQMLANKRGVSNESINGDK